nr:hypothetical protein Iba_chr15cCG7260 [Ipomoea batatas]
MVGASLYVPSIQLKNVKMDGLHADLRHKHPGKQPREAFWLAMVITGYMHP